jgi:hypothetical protein
VTLAHHVMLVPALLFRHLVQLADDKDALFEVHVVHQLKNVSLGVEDVKLLV